MEEEYFDPSKFVIRSISKSVAKELIVKNHYSHKWTLCTVAYGVFYKQEDTNSFIPESEKLIGACIYGTPVGRSAADSFSSLIKSDEVFELTRLWIADCYGKNIESWTIRQTFVLIKKEFPHIKLILSYADSEQKHLGGIYKASNFLFLGLTSNLNLMPNYSISLDGPPNYNWVHSRTVFSLYGSHNIDYLKKKIGKTFWRKKESGKYKYIYILSNKIERKNILKTLKHPPLPYPAKNDIIEEIVERYDALNKKTENEFFS